MPRRISEPSSMLSMSRTKYILRKDVFYIKSMQIQPLLKFGQEPLYKEDDEVLKIGLSDDNKGTNDGKNDVWSPSSFLEALIYPYLPRFHKNIRQEFFFYKSFLWNMDINPLFYRFIIKETKYVEWIKYHRSELAYLLLLDILSENVPTIKEANLEYQEDYREEDRTRQRRLLRNEYYPELFFNPTDYIEKRKDERDKNYSTVATENPSFGEEYIWSVQLMMALNQEFVSNLPSQRELDNWDYLNICIKIVSADEIQDLITFSDELNKALDRVLLRVSNLDGDRKIIVDEIRKKTDLIEQFREILNMAIFVRWFTSKTLNEQQKLLEKKHRLKYSEMEAQKVVPLLLEYYKDPELVIAYLYFGERAFRALKKIRVEKLLKNERKKLERTKTRKKNKMQQNSFYENT